MQKTFKLFILVVLFLSSNTVFGQKVEIEGANEVEVGIPTDFTLKFIPPNSLPSGVASYRITQWHMSNPDSPSNTSIVGFTGISSNINSIAYYDYGSSLPNQKTYSFQWGDNGKDNGTIDATVYIEYLNSQGNVVDYKTFSPIAPKQVRILSIKTPSFLGVNSVVNCSQTTFTQSVSAGSANSFAWSITGGSGDGSIVSGNGTATASIKPPLTGDFQISVLAKRTTAHPSYSRTGGKTFSRTARTTDYTVQPILVSGISTTPNYVCKGENRTLEILDDGYISSVVWNSPNSTVSQVQTVSGKRIYALSVNSSVSISSQIQATATVTYQGGCVATTSTRNFIVYSAEAPPTPNGYIYLVPSSGNVCNPEGFEVRFSSSYTNGKVTITPAFIPPHAPNRAYSFKVCYTNPCSGQQACKDFIAYPPAPCIKDFRTTESKSNFTISPNPNQGEFVISFTEPQTGQYIIYDLNGVIVDEREFKETEKLPVFIRKSVKKGNYIVRTITENFYDYQTLIIE